MNKKTGFVIFALVLLAGIFLAGCGPLPAGAEIKVNPDGKSAQVEFTGIVDSIAADLWVVAGQSLVVSPLTILDSSILVGDKVKVHATVALDGTVNADSIKLYTPEHSSTPGDAHPGGEKETEFTGVVESITPEAWVVSGTTFTITIQTEIKGTIIVGDQVKIEALVGTDGTTTALEIKLAEETSPSDGEVKEMEFEGVVELIGLDSWTVGGQIFAVSADTEIEGTILVGDLVKIEALVGTDGTITAHEIKLIEEEGMSSDDGSRDEFTGVVESIGPDSWTVGGQVFAITADTEIEGTIIAGDTVKVEAISNPDGTLTAHEIKILGSDDSDSHDSENDDHSSNPGSGRSSDDGDEHGSHHEGGFSSEGDD